MPRGVNAIVGDAPQEEESIVSMVEVDEHAEALLTVPKHQF